MSSNVLYIGRCPHGQVIAVASQEDRDEIADEMGEFLKSGFVIHILSERNPAPPVVACLPCAKTKEPSK